MRSFEERRAEILRRSEARLRKKKRQRQILNLCIPLLCIGISAAALLPQWGEHSQPASAESYTQSQLLDFADITVVETQVSSEVSLQGELSETADAEILVFLDGTCCFSAAGEKAAGILLLVEQIVDSGTAVSHSLADAEAEGARESCYRLVLCGEEEKVFYWSERALTDYDKGVSYSLTAEQTEALQTYTGLG